MNQTTTVPASDSPIFRLPLETLEKIFATILDGCCQCSHPGRLRPVTILCLVCRRWRDTIYGCGRLWRTIDLSNLKKAKYNLQKAGDAPLDVYYTPGSSLWHRPPFPAALFKQHTATMQEVEITDVYDTLEILSELSFPILQKLVFDNITRVEGLTRGISLPAHLSYLQELRLRSVPRILLQSRSLVLTRRLVRRVVLDSNNLLSILHEGNLRILYLMEVIFSTPLDIPTASLSMPHLREARLELPEFPVLLFGMRDIPNHATIDVGLPKGSFDLLDADARYHDLWRGLYPFRFARVRWLQARVIFVDARTQNPSRDRYALNANLVFSYTFDLGEVDKCLVEQTEPLDMVELEMKNQVRLSLARLPPFKAISFTADTAAEGFEQLRSLSDSATHVLEHIILEDVPLGIPTAAVLAAASSVDDMPGSWPGVPQPTASAVLYATLVLYLKERSEQGQRVKRLTLRECHRRYSAGVQDGLRSWVDYLELENLPSRPPHAH